MDLGAAKVFAYAGPSLQMGLASTSKITVGGTTNTTNNYDNDSYGRMNVLVGGGIGADIADMLRLTVGYDFGLLDRNSSDNVSLKTSQLHVGVAYLF